jgi:hypothetical protein
MRCMMVCFGRHLNFENKYCSCNLRMYFFSDKGVLVCRLWGDWRWGVVRRLIY